MEFVRRLTRPVLASAGALFVIYLVAHSWVELEPLLKSIDWPVFVLSMVIGILGNFAIALYFRDALQKYGVTTSLPESNEMFFVGQIAKYVPGKIWGVMYQLTSLGHKGALGAVALANIDLMIVAIIITATISMGLMVAAGSFSRSLPVFVVGLLLCVYVSQGSHLFNFARRLLGVFKRTGNQAVSCSPAREWYYPAAYFVFALICYLGASILMMESVFDFSLQQSLRYIAYLGLSWIIGTLAIVFPAGIGVKEAAFLFFSGWMAHAASLEVLAAVAVVHRVWQMLQELFGAGLCLVPIKRWKSIL